MNWETIITPGKDSENYISYSFINNGLIFNIISIKNVGYELYINNKSFKELEKLSKKNFFSDIINNESKTSCLINKGNKNKENKEINCKKILNNENIDNIQQSDNKVSCNEKDNLNEIKQNLNKINENDIDCYFSQLSLETKPKTRNNKSNINYQSSDELLKIAMNKEKKHIKESPNSQNYLSNLKVENELPSFARSLPVSIYHVYQSKNENMPKNCSICLEDFIIGRKIITLPCFHFFHVNCVSKWLKTNGYCPICKLDITDEIKKNNNNNNINANKFFI